jgi:glutamate racemase
MTVVVRADDYLDAHFVTGKHVQEIVRDIGVGDIIVRREVENEDHLPYCWDADLVPYGWKQDKTIGDILNDRL